MAETFIKSLLSKNLPGFDELTLEEQSRVAAAFLGVPDIGLAARAIGVEFEEPGFTSGLVSGLSSFPQGAGEFIRATAGPGPVSDALIKLGEDAQFRRPQLSLFNDGLSAIPGIIGQAAGVSLPAFAMRGPIAGGLSVAARLPGIIGGTARLVAPAVRAADTTLGRSVLFGTPTFGQAAGQIRREQGRELTPGETLQALAGALTVGRLETLGGVERAFEKGIGSLIPQEGGSLLRRVGIGALQSGGTEATEELLQAPFEQLAASQPLSEINPVDVLEQVASGFVGGAALGTAAAPFSIASQNARERARAAERQAAALQAEPTIPFTGGVGQQLELPLGGEPQQLELPLPEGEGLPPTPPPPTVTGGRRQVPLTLPTIGGQQLELPLAGPQQLQLPLTLAPQQLELPLPSPSEAPLPPLQQPKTKAKKGRKKKAGPPQTPGTTFNVRTLKGFEQANDDFAKFADSFAMSGGHRNSLRHLVRTAGIDTQADDAQTIRTKLLDALKNNKFKNPDTETRIKSIFSIKDEELRPKKAPAVKGFEGATEGFNEFAKKFLDAGGRAPSIKTIVERAGINPKKDDLPTIKNKVAKAIEAGKIRHKATSQRLQSAVGVESKPAPETKAKSKKAAAPAVKTETLPALKEAKEADKQLRALEEEVAKKTKAKKAKKAAKPPVTPEEALQQADIIEEHIAKTKAKKAAAKKAAAKKAAPKKAEAKAKKPAAKKTETPKAEAKAKKTETPKKAEAKAKKPTAKKAEAPKKVEEKPKSIAQAVEQLVSGEREFQHIKPKEPTEPTNAELQAEVEKLLGKKVPTNSVKTQASLARGRKSANLIHSLIKERAGRKKKPTTKKVTKELIEAYNKAGGKKKPADEKLTNVLEHVLTNGVSTFATKDLVDKFGFKNSIEAGSALKKAIRIVSDHAKDSETLTSLRKEVLEAKRAEETPTEEELGPGEIVEEPALTQVAEELDKQQEELGDKQVKIGPQLKVVKDLGKATRGEEKPKNADEALKLQESKNVAKSVLSRLNKLTAGESAEERQKKIDQLVRQAVEEWDSRGGVIRRIVEETMRRGGAAVHDDTIDRNMALHQRFHNINRTAKEWFLYELARDVPGEIEETRAERLTEAIRNATAFSVDPNLAYETTEMRVIGLHHTKPFVIRTIEDEYRAKDLVKSLFAKYFKKINHNRLFIFANVNDPEIPEYFREEVRRVFRKDGVIGFADLGDRVFISGPTLVQYATVSNTSVDNALEAIIAHEVGVHVKVHRLGAGVIRELASVIRRWAEDPSHPAHGIAKLALRDALSYTGSENLIANEELIAYFVTRSIIFGNTSILNNNGYRGLIRRIKRFFRHMMRRLGLIPKYELTEADLVDFVTGLTGIQLDKEDGLVLSTFDTNAGFSSATMRLFQQPIVGYRFKDSTKLPTKRERFLLDFLVKQRERYRPGATKEEMFEFLRFGTYALEDNNITKEEIKDFLNKIETVIYKNGHTYPVHNLKSGINRVNSEEKYEEMPLHIRNALHKLPDFDKFLEERRKLGLSVRFYDIYDKYGQDELVKVGIDGIIIGLVSRSFVTPAMIHHPPNDVDGYMGSYAKMVDMYGYEAATPHLPPGGMERATRSFVDAYIPEQFRDRAFSAAMTLQDALHKFDLAMDFSHNLVRRFRKVLPSLTKYMDFSERASARQRHYELKVSQIAERMLALPEEHQKRVRKLLFDMTWNEKWSFKPEWRPKDEVKVDPEYARRFEQLSDEEKIVVKEILKLGDDTLDLKRRLMMQEVEDLHEARLEAIEENLTGEEKEKALKEEEARYKQHKKLVADRVPGRLKGPYVPLRRRGAYAVVAMSKELAEARRALSAAKGDEQVQPVLRDIKQLEANPNHYIVIFKPTMGQAKLAAEQLQQFNDFEVVDVFERHKYYQSIDHLPDSMFTMFEQLLSSTRELREATEKVRIDLRGIIHDAYISTYQDIAAHQSALTRRKVHGITEDDIFEGFIEQGRSDAHFLAQLEYGRFVWRALRDMRKEAAIPGEVKGFEREERMRVFNEMAKRQAIFTMSSDSNAVNTILSFGSFMQLLTSPAFYLQNLTQPWMMSLPYMAGKYDYTEIATTLLDAYKRVSSDPALKVTQWPINIDKMESKVGKEAEAIKELLDRGRIDIGIDVELGQMLDQSPLRSTLGRAVFHLSRIARRVEVINRLTTALTAYRLEYERAKKEGRIDERAHEQALEYANEVILQTHGDYAKFNSPVLFHKNGLLRVLTQFRKFQLIQARLIWNMLNDALRKANPIERAAARRALLYTMGTTVMMTGIRGLPLWAPMALLYAIANGDDPEDFETWLRRHAGADSPLVDLLFTGLPKLVGLDLTNKIGMGQVFNPIPFIDFDVTTRDGYARTLVALGGPIVGGLGPRFANGINLMYMGNYWRGLEELMPRGLRDTMRAYRYASEGMTTQRGFQLMDAEEISLYDALTQAVGLPSNKISRTQARRAAMFEVDDYFKRRSSILRARYFRAVKRRDEAERKQIMQEWREMNERRKELGLRPRPLSGLTSVVREGIRLERRVVGGIQFTDATRKYAEDLAHIY